MPIIKLFGMIFEWHDPKFELVFSKRQINIKEAASVFFDVNAITIEDQGEYHEQRLVIVGMSDQSRMLAVVYTQRDETFRIITAYFPSKHQVREYDRQKFSIL